jgi:hypothetical protein
MYLVTRFDLYTMNPKRRLDLRDVPSPAVEQIKAAMKEPARVVGFDWLMTPGFNTVLGLETISGPDPLQNPAMRALTISLGLPEIWYWRIIVDPKDFAKNHRALDMLGVRYYLDAKGAGSRVPDTKLLGSFDLDVVESSTAWPRAFYTDTVAAYEHVPEFVRLVKEGDGRPFAAMFAPERAPLPLPARDFSARQIVPARNYRLTQNATRFEVDASGPGMAVLGEAWVQGDLEAFVDGQPADPLRVNHAFRGVYLPKAGHYVVEFRYSPAMMAPALWLALLGFLGALWSAWVLLRRRPAPAPMTPAVPRELAPAERV